MTAIERFYPAQRNAPDEGKPFEIAFALAGAISGGAYTAGFLDFFIEAMDAWYAAKADGKAVPCHTVTLNHVAGSSAGGICGAILMSSAEFQLPPCRDIENIYGKAPPSWLENPFYRTWVDQIDIRHLLGTEDIGQGRQVESLLDCTQLEALSDYITNLKMRPADQKSRTWLLDPFTMDLTVGNLRGMPYDVMFNGSAHVDHRMWCHCDHLSFARFVFKNSGTLAPHLIRLDNPRRYGSLLWQQLGAAALASAAFPLFLKPQLLSRPLADYDYRFASYEEVDGKKVLVAPAPSRMMTSGLYSFLAVDGGAFNNEPFDLAHRALAGLNGENPRDGDKAHRAVVMIDPFPSEEGIETKYNQRHRLTGLVAGILNMYKSQARFRPMDLELATNENIYSRFLVTPARDDVRGSAALGAGELQGFSAFLHENLRRHDFFLGRYNAYRFLTRHFLLPAGNPIVKNGYGGLPQSSPYQLMLQRDGYAPIIPVVDGVVIPKLPPWPRLDVDGIAEDLERRLRSRMDLLMPRLPAVAKGLADTWLSRLTVGVIAGAVQPMIKKKIAMHGMEAIRGALKELQNRI